MDGGINGNWEYDFYQGFKIRKITWDLGGEYICSGEFQTPSSLSNISGVIINNKISRDHSFTVDVKGFSFSFIHEKNCNYELMNYAH